MGGDLGETVPPKFEVGDGPCIRPPYIWRKSVISCEGKYEVTKKGEMKAFFYCEIEGPYMLYIRFKTVETGKRRSMTKKVFRNFRR